MDIKLVEQQCYFVFEWNEKYYRVSFERTQDADWAVRLIDVSRNESVYSRVLEAIVVPDLQLAEKIIKTYFYRHF
jgi:hypothetical protein